MTCKGIVARVVCRYGHNGTGTITGEDVLGNVDGALLASDGVDAVRTREHACYGTVYLALTLGAALHVGQVLVHLLFLLGRGELCYKFAFGSQHEEGDTEHGVGTGGEDGELYVAVCHLYLHLGTFATAYPVLLCLLDAVAPLDGIQAIQKSLGICAHTQTPLAHLLLLHGISAALAHAVDNLIVGQYGTQFGAPVYHCLAQEGYAVVHQCLALLLLAHCLPLIGGEAEFLRACGIDALGTLCLEIGNELVNGLCLAQGCVEV